MSEILDSAETGLKGKIGPVPVWLIALAVGLAAIVGYYLYSKRASNVAASPGSTAAVTTDPSDSGASTGTTDSSYSTDGAPAATSDDTAVTTPASNSAWLTKAATAVAAENGASMSDVYAGLSKYLAGSAITTTEKGWVDQALSVAGIPPEGVNDISPVIAAPSTAATTAATTAAATPVPATVTPTTPVLPKPTVSPVVSKPSLDYGAKNDGASIYFLVYKDGSKVLTTKERAESAPGGLRIITDGGKIIKGPGVSYVKLKGTANIYAHSAALGYYHLSEGQYAAVGHPSYSTVGSIH